MSCLNRVGGGEIRRKSETRNVSIPGDVDRNSKTMVSITATKIRRVAQRPAAIEFCDKGIVSERVTAVCLESICNGKVGGRSIPSHVNVGRLIYRDAVRFILCVATKVRRKNIGRNRWIQLGDKCVPRIS